MWVGCLCQAFSGRGEEEEELQQGGNRQQTPTLELSTTLMPPQENTDHFIHLSSPLQFQNYICICRLNATLGIEFPKSRCQLFSPRQKLKVTDAVGKRASWPDHLASLTHGIALAEAAPPVVSQ